MTVCDMNYDKYFDEAVELVEIAIHGFDLSKHRRGKEIYPFFSEFRDHLKSGRLSGPEYRHAIALYVLMRLAMRRRPNRDQEGIASAYADFCGTLAKCAFSDADKMLLLIVASQLANVPDEQYQMAYRELNHDDYHPVLYRMAEPLLT